MNKKSFLNLAIILSVIIMIGVIYYWKYMRMESDFYVSPELTTQYNAQTISGSQSCVECHEDVFKSHIKTAHFNTSAPADSTTIKASFKEGSNILDLDNVIFEMKEEQGAFYQHTKIKNRTVQIVPAQFDIVIGSGVRGQSYLTWKADELFQLQPSYHTPSDDWINSPGYPDYYLERPIRNACLKCHVTFGENKEVSRTANQYYKDSFILGVDCEKCHGPSAKHVDYHKKNKVEVPEFVVLFDTLSRQQRLDVCAQCHSGLLKGTGKGNSFSFLPGESLIEYADNTVKPTNATLDVHGNQYGLLTQSECFKKTTRMDCSTCHNPHENQRGNTSYFNQKCIGCHTTETAACTDESFKTKTMTGNDCIACHMPIIPSKSMTARLGKDSLETSFNIRTHLIAIYDQQQH